MVFSNETVFSFFLIFFHHMATVLELQLQHQQYSGLISFRIEWFDFIAVQATLRSLLQHHSSKVINSSVLLFIVPLSHPYITTKKTIALTIQILAGKVKSLLFNMLSSFVIAFSPRSKCLNFMAAITIHSNFGA